VKTPGSQMGSPAAAEEGGEEVGGGRWEIRHLIFLVFFSNARSGRGAPTLGILTSDTDDALLVPD